MLKPVRKRTLSDEVFAQLRDQIVSGERQPGSVLPAERELGEKLGVNRGAVREALRRLAQARLVAIQHGGSTRVLDYRQTAGLDMIATLLLRPSGKLNTHVARSVVEMRAALAPDIARLAATRRRPAQADRITQVVRAMEEAADDLPELQLRVMELWDVLVDASDNVAYRLAYNSLRETYDNLRDLLRVALADELRDLDAYQALANAVAASSPEAAEAAARRAISLGSSGLMKMLSAVEVLELEEGL